MQKTRILSQVRFALENRVPVVRKMLVRDFVAQYKGSGRNITMDNYFTTLSLAKSLLPWDLTIVSTLKKNKTCIPPAMTALKTREELSTVFDFHEKVTMCSYVPKKNKAVIMLPSMHQVAKIGDDAKKKPEIIELYNWSKAGVDTMDKMLGRYTRYTTKKINSKVASSIFLQYSRCYLPCSIYPLL